MEKDQENFWSGSFGEEYRERNTFSPSELNDHYQKIWGVSRTEMNKEFLSSVEIHSILEVGCNVGNQLRLLSEMGFKDLHGIEVNENAAQKARSYCCDANIQSGSALELPFEDDSFDLVFTSGVLIHIHPTDLPKVISEMVRVSKKYIWGFEYYNEQPMEIEYRGHNNKLWKNDFVKVFHETSDGLKEVKKMLYKYVANENLDLMYLLSK